MTIAALSSESTIARVAQLALAQGIENRRILDLGAGEGFLSRELGHAIAAAGKNPADILTASDIDPANFRYDGIDCVHGDFNASLPFPDNHFDTVCFVEVIEHLEDQFKAVREIHRILKPGGNVIMTTPNIMNINSRLRFLGCGLYLLFDILPYQGNIDMSTAHGHINPVSYIHLAFMLKHTGFASVAFTPDRIKRSALALALPLYPILKLLEYISLSRPKRKDPHPLHANPDILATLNSLPLLTSRSLILTAVKGPSGSIVD